MNVALAYSIRLGNIYSILYRSDSPNIYISYLQCCIRFSHYISLVDIPGGLFVQTGPVHSESELAGFTPYSFRGRLNVDVLALTHDTVRSVVRGKKRRRGISPGCPSNRYTTRKH